MIQTLGISLEDSEIATLSDHRYVFVSHTCGDNRGAIEYYLTYPEGTDDIEAAQFVAWGSGSDLPIPDFVMDLDAERPLIEVDAARTSQYRLVLLKRRYGAGDRSRVDERGRRRLWGRARRDCVRLQKSGLQPVRVGWLDLDYEAFWAKGGIAGLRDSAVRQLPRITSVV